MRWLVAFTPLWLVACASQDLTWVDQEGQAQQVLPASEQALILPEGERTPAAQLAVPIPPQVALRDVEMNLEPGEVIDGNGVPVLNLNMSSVAALNKLSAELAQYDIDVVDVNESGSVLTIQSTEFTMRSNPNWFNRYDQRLQVSFADIGSQSRLSVWRLDNTQPEETIRQDVFAILKAILIDA